jgi:hypothetical protein
MAAMAIAQKTLTKATISPEFLETLKAKGHIDDEVLALILADEDLKHFFSKPKTKVKKEPTKKKQSPKVSDTDRNDEEYDQTRCSARVWKPVDASGKPCSGKYGGLDNVQCSSSKIIDGSCFCNKHHEQDEAMKGIGGYWLGKVNEPRPDNPLLPKSLGVKKGYDLETLIPHYWLKDSEGNLVEKGSGRKKKEKVEKEVVKEKKEEDEGGKEKKVVKKKVIKKKVAKKLVQKVVEEVDKEEKPKGAGVSVTDDEDDEDGQDKDDEPFVFEGVSYLKHWDGDVDGWVAIDSEEWCKVGDINDEGGIDFVDDEERGKHELCMHFARRDRVIEMSLIEKGSDRKKVMEEPEDKPKGAGVSETDDEDDEDTDEDTADEKHDVPFEFEGISYLKHWGEDDDGALRWTAVEIGTLRRGEGCGAVGNICRQGIEFYDGEREKHENRVNEMNKQNN